MPAAKDIHRGAAFLLLTNPLRPLPIPIIRIVPPASPRIHFLDANLSIHILNRFFRCWLPLIPRATIALLLLHRQQTSQMHSILRTILYNAAAVIDHDGLLLDCENSFPEPLLQPITLLLFLHVLLLLSIIEPRVISTKPISLQDLGLLLRVVGLVIILK